MKKLLLIPAYVLALSYLISCGGNTDSKVESEGKVNIYSQRHYDTDDSLYSMFTKKTGIKVNLITAKADELINRLEMEGKNSPADILITVDAERLYRAKAKNLLQKVQSSVLDSMIPELLRDKENYWYAMAYRARIIAYSKERVNPEDLSTYEALTDNKWKGKILVRSSESAYNQALLSSIIEADGLDSAKKWAASIVKNMARDPKGNDRDQVKAMSGGAGDIAIINSYYFASMLNSNEPAEREAAEKAGAFFPNQDGRGTHINISGVALTANAPNKENAIKLIEFLLSEEAQNYITNTNYEYPANKNVKPSKFLLSWGDFKADYATLPLLEQHNKEALMTFNEVGWK